MNSSSDPFPPSMDSPQIFDTDMNGSMQDNDLFFNSALPTDSADQFFGDDSLISSPFRSPVSTKAQTMSMSQQSVQNPSEMSTSPEGSDSSSDLSGRKRKSISRSSGSATDINMADAGQNGPWNTSSNVKKEPMFISDAHSLDRFEFSNRAMENDFDFDSAASSPSPLMASKNVPFNGLRHVAIPNTESPRASVGLLSHTGRSQAVRVYQHSNRQIVMQVLTSTVSRVHAIHPLYQQWSRRNMISQTCSLRPPKQAHLRSL